MDSLERQLPGKLEMSDLIRMVEIADFIRKAEHNLFLALMAGLSGV
ncbi:hypothetical protein ACSAZL_16990 [Methanosarcina sp. T3]